MRTRQNMGKKESGETLNNFQWLEKQFNDIYFIAIFSLLVHILLLIFWCQRTNPKHLVWIVCECASVQEHRDNKVISQLWMLSIITWYKWISDGCRNHYGRKHFHELLEGGFFRYKLASPSKSSFASFVANWRFNSQYSAIKSNFIKLAMAIVRCLLDSIPKPFLPSHTDAQ